MIRVEVTCEADVTRMVAAFQVLESLSGCDYEIWLVSGSGPGGGGGMRRAWREDGLRGGRGTLTAVTKIQDGPSLSGTGTISGDVTDG